MSQIQELHERLGETVGLLKTTMEEVKALKEKAEKHENATMKLISEFERHSHNGLGVAVIPVS